MSRLRWSEMFLLVAMILIRDAFVWVMDKIPGILTTTVFGRRVLWHLNVFVCQWLWFRVYIGCADAEVVKIGIFYWIAPCTGWWSDYWPLSFGNKTLWTYKPKTSLARLK